MPPAGPPCDVTFPLSTGNGREARRGPLLRPCTLERKNWQPDLRGGLPTPQTALSLVSPAGPRRRSDRRKGPIRRLVWGSGQLGSRGHKQGPERLEWGIKPNPAWPGLQAIDREHWPCPTSQRTTPRVPRADGSSDCLRFSKRRGLGHKEVAESADWIPLPI